MRASLNPQVQPLGCLSILDLEVLRNFGLGTPVALTDGAAITMDCSKGSIFSWTAGTANTLTPINMFAGQIVYLIVTDTAATKIVTPGTGLKLVGGAWTTAGTAGRFEVLTFISDGTNLIEVGTRAVSF
jgi:hypothetical protein